MNKYIKRGIAFILIAAVAGGSFYIYTKTKHKKNIPAALANINNSLTYTVNKGNIINTVTATGTVMLNNEVDVYAEGETNKIQAFHIEEGDAVSVGQLLVTYDTKDSKEELENKIRDTKRDIENAQLNLKSIQTPASETEIKKLENDIANNEKALTEAQDNLTVIQTSIKQQNTEIENAKKDWQEAQKNVNNNGALLNVGGITQEEYDESITSCERAKQTYENALDSLDSLNINFENAEASITSQQNALELSKATLQETLNKQDLEENKIKLQQQQLTLQGLQDTLADAQKDLSDIVNSTYSTVNGIVTEVCVDEGTYTEENTVMLKVADLNDLIVSANIEEYDAPLLALGQRVTMTSDGLEGKTYTGKITKINATASSASSNMGTETVVPIEISVDNPDGVLKANYNLDLEITTSSCENVLCIPTSSISTEGKARKSYVYKVENNILTKAYVETGEANDSDTQLISGLNEGDIIISAISENIKEGMSLDQLKSTAKASSNSKKEATDNDKNRQSEQMLPSGGFGGSGPRGGFPTGGGR